MIRPQPFAQPIGEGIKLHLPTERAEGRRIGVRTLAASTDRVARRTHSFRKSVTLFFQRGSFPLLGEAGRCCEQQKGHDGPRDHSGFFSLFGVIPRLRRGMYFKSGRARWIFVSINKARFLKGMAVRAERLAGLIDWARGASAAVRG
jgi:hypothetical protein